MQRLRRFLRELKRRNVYRVAVTYAVVAFVVWQAANLLFPALAFPAWTVDFVIVLTLLGFPVALVLAWAFEMTPEGMRRTETREAERSSGAGYQWIGLVLVVALAGGVWYATTGGAGESGTADTAAGDTATQTTTTARDTTGPPRIAVLPFENIARDSSDAFFARGVHEEVLNQLSKVSGLEVISRTSVMRYADTEKPVPTISHELGGVNAVLEGTVRRAAGQVRITTQLIDAREDEHLWSKIYQRELSVDQIFQIQADIAEQIARALETELAGGERQRIADAPTDDLGAYDAFLEGRSLVDRFWSSRDPRYLDRAIRHLRESLSQDSTIAEAYAWLGRAYQIRSEVSGKGRWRDSATAATSRALALGPNSAAVHAARGRVFFEQDSITAAEEAARRAIDLQPSNSRAVMLLADIFRRRGNRAESIRWARRAVQLDPRNANHMGELGYRLRFIGMLDLAEVWFRRAFALDSTAFERVWDLAHLQLDRKQYRVAERLADAFLSDHPDDPWGLALAAEVALHREAPGRAKRYLERIPQARRNRLSKESPSRPDRVSFARRFERIHLGSAELRLGNRERGRKLLTQVADRLRSMNIDEGPEPLAAIQLAPVLSALGRRQAALRQLEEGVLAGAIWADWFRRYALFDGLRSMPRFEKVVRRAEAEQETIQEKIRRMGVDLYPPGAGKNSVQAKSDVR